MPEHNLIAPLHPGEVLAEDFMKPVGLSMNGLALEIRVSPSRIHAIVKGTRGITADTALRLGRYFSTTNEFWMNLQARYDLDVAVD